MHRHGYQGRKFSRERDQRRALMKGLATSLVEHGRIETTLPKAKELRRYAEKLITKAKKADLASRRQVIAGLSTQVAAFHLVDEIAPQLVNRNSGYLRIERTRLRVGDGAQMAIIEFVDKLGSSTVQAEKPKTTDKPVAPKKKSSTANKPVATKTTKSADKHLSQKPTVLNKRSGER